MQVVHGTSVPAVGFSRAWYWSEGTLDPQHNPVLFIVWTLIQQIIISFIFAVVFWSQEGQFLLMQKHLHSHLWQLARLQASLSGNPFIRCKGFRCQGLPVGAFMRKAALALLSVSSEVRILCPMRGDESTGVRLGEAWLVDGTVWWGVGGSWGAVLSRLAVCWSVEELFLQLRNQAELVQMGYFKDNVPGLTLSFVILRGLRWFQHWFSCLSLFHAGFLLLLR